MNERKRNAWIGVGLKPWPKEKEELQPQTDIPEEIGVAIGSTALSASEEIRVVALDDQVPRSWDLHKSGY